MKGKINPGALIFLIWAGMGMSACASTVTYSADPIEAWLVDAETRQPLEGAVVVARWALEAPTVIRFKVRPAGHLVILETVTDRNGRFYFPAWGPTRLWGRSRLTHMDPELLVFKSGYEYRRLNNYEPRSLRVIGRSKDDPVVQEIERLEQGIASRRYSEWHGKTIEMKPFKGTGQEYARHLAGDYRSAIGFLLESEEWRKTPCLLSELDAEAKRLGYRGFLALFAVPDLEHKKRITELLQGENLCKRR